MINPCGYCYNEIHCAKPYNVTFKGGFGHNTPACVVEFQECKNIGKIHKNKVLCNSTYMLLCIQYVNHSSLYYGVYTVLIIIDDTTVTIRM